MTASNVIDSKVPGWGDPAPVGGIGYVPVHALSREQPVQRIVTLPHAPVWLRWVDLAIVVAALCAAHVSAVLRTGSLRPDAVLGVTLRLSHVLALLLAACVWHATYHLFGLYKPRRPGLGRELGSLAFACVVGALFTVLVHRSVADAVAYHGRVAFESAVRLWGMAFALSAMTRSMRSIVACWCRGVDVLAYAA